jgi:hypothetical protein
MTGPEIQDLHSSNSEQAQDQSAMGEAFSSVTDDATAFIYNPARLSLA